MGTEKRERQKANKQQRQMEEARQERSSKARRNVLRWTAAIIAAVGGVVLIAWVGGAFDGDSDDEETTVTLPPLETTPDDTAPVDTAPEDTLPVPEKPEVEIPDEIPTELVVTVLEEGDGPIAEEGDAVLVHYVGVRSEDGTEFDNSYDRGQPFEVAPLGSAPVIDGWNEGLIGAQEGSRIQLDIPADMAYGDQGRGEIIQPGDALTFVIDVMMVTPATGG